MFRLRRLPAFAAGVMCVLSVQFAHANLVINPAWDASITSDPNSATIMNTINSAIAFYNQTFTDNITVEIRFQEMSSGLGASTTGIFRPSYVAYRSALQADATTANDFIALSHLPNQTLDPVTNAHANIVLARANARALGGTTSPGTDGTVFFNASICNFDRVNINPTKFDLYAVTCHEIDEVLGMGSWIDGPISSDAAIRAMDLFRYDAAGNRSFTNNTSAHAFFSLDGTNDIVEFNQSGVGDWGDWVLHSTPQVQDYSGTRGVPYDMGYSEVTALDAIGYNAVPEPASMACFGIGLMALWRMRTRRNRRP